MTAPKWPLLIVLGLVLTGAIAAPATAQATAPASRPAEAAPLIADIRVEGNKTMSTLSVMSYVKSRPGQAYDEKLIKADEKRLLQSRKFQSVETHITPTAQGMVVTFIITERPVVKRVAIEGARQFKEGELLKDVPFGPGDAVDTYTIDQGALAITNKYHEKGYYEVSVKVEPEPLKKNEVVYRVIEGPQVRVKSIKLEGNKAVSSFRVYREINSMSQWWPIIQGYYDPDQVDRDVIAVRNYYVSEGFLDCEVASRTQFTQDQKKLTLFFEIKEGPQYRVNEVRFVGNTIIDSEQLGRDLLLRRGEHFTNDKLQRDIKKLQDKYGAIGFIEASVDSQKEILSPAAPPPAWACNVDGGHPALLNMVFKIKEDDQYRVGRIDIRGNHLSQTRIIRREMRIYPEQLFDTVAVEETRQRLLETRLFDKITVTPVGKGEKVRDALVEVQEARTGEFMVGVGVSSDAGLLGNVSFTQRNFDVSQWPNNFDDVIEGKAWKGAGQTFRISVEPGTQVNRATISWFEPYWADQPYSLGASAFVFTRDRETYRETRIGGVGSVGHRFANGWYAELAPGAQEVDISNLDDEAPPEVRRDEGWHFLPDVKGSLVKDNTDSRWLPSQGDRIRLSYDQIYGEYHFGRGTADYQAFQTVWVDSLDRKHILSERVSAGQIWGFAPVFEEFYAGGTGSVRGFRYRGISPRSGHTDQPIGGDWLFFAGTEYSFPIIGDQLRGVTFIDSGTVEPNVGFNQYRVAVGVGIRWIIPLLGPTPISIDFGIPLLKYDHDRTEIVSFNMGAQF